MAMTNAQRQAKYREKHQETHKTIEVVLERHIYDKLQRLALTSGKSRKDIITELILAAQSPDSLQATNTKIAEAVKLWRGVNRCQSSRANGKPCRIQTNVEIVSFTFKNQIYQALSCQQHKDCFSIHSNHF